ncbi:MAG TPA: DUF2330 domain-containing protein [Cyanobacteria bacterium UBA11149]|nr:DUF2330 domain-containing protein [Cyanobacteria bacterium UBA11367]HBE56544.1 DUF2330 domain-containing protein [Cyanobacteria bacterium UBA11366]HBK62362.1 DUF2330 domain-containing protein [Cyanobacteria bacterium UBA11166]HBR75667.1 DUF2330 domain-containing protein [Cyanobacteria bacterium UBA11159]HBS68597.1 DUF2330 domain-containing protein [Cyanobacteria bacterium UBA11153]HBW91130.1 DUF2330 domain-containing protein [Cyanobacteria bacterium UBA11149]HCA97990.1 DUF2330 domain-conta
MKLVRIVIALVLATIAVISFALPAFAFCGFYVAKADTKLYNQASQVIIARNGDRNILTMANDYQGDVKDFALVVPVPVVLEKEQVNVGDSKIIERLDGFSAPRLVEYFDRNPCEENIRRVTGNDRVFLRLNNQNRESGERALGVTIEAQFTVGEYDILILSAKESNGLETWLKQNDYQIPNGASRLLQTYIRQGMKFFVAKVNLAEFEKAGYQLLRPLQMAYESPRFMLPIRLGMINGKSAQDLVVYILSPQGQAEITNYRTVKVPSDAEIPLFVKEEFGDFYKSMFQQSYQKEGKKVAFLEYAWNMGWCDPCAAEPLTNEELKKAGVFWLNSNQGTNVFITRLHVRYSRDKFPEDLIFQETANTEQFQGRYILRHPFSGEMDCDAGKEYQESLPERYEEEAQTLAKLTGWKIEDIREKMNISQRKSENWWHEVF